MFHVLQLQLKLTCWRIHCVFSGAGSPHILHINTSAKTALGLSQVSSPSGLKQRVHRTIFCSHLKTSFTDVEEGHGILFYIVTNFTRHASFQIARFINGKNLVFFIGYLKLTQADDAPSPGLPFRWPCL